MACYQTVGIFNTSTCVWTILGSQPAQPTGLSCWQTSTFNSTSCSWDVSGTQAPQPTGLSCWQTATFNTTSCSWDVSGNQPVQPTLDFCETTLFNVDSCAWIISSTIQENTVNVDTISPYLWLVNGQTYTSSGSYEFLDSANCILQILNLTLSIGLSEESSNSLSISPNPTNGNVVISLFSDDQCRLNVYDSQGQLVFENPSISNGYGVNLSDYSPGVYIFRVYTSNQIYTRRIIKN